MKNIYKILFVCLFAGLIALTGCTRVPKHYFRRAEFLERNAYCTRHFASVLVKNGIGVFQTKDNIMLFANNLFVGNSANFTGAAYNALDAVVALLQCCDLEDINITGVMSYYGGEARTMALAAERAKRVKAYLWSQHINASIIFASGAISSLPMTRDKSTNRNCIIITFSKDS
jgi:outer membrane protein OmpA-like peptidoglycan-associated protein